MSSATPNILVVDDEDVMRAYLGEIFAEHYQVTCVETGEQCMASLAEQGYDLVLLDVNLPGVNGYDVCTHIRSTPAIAKTPIVFVSAKDSVEERLKGYEVGADDYITKPLSEDALLEVVDSVLASSLEIKKIEAQSREAMHTAFQAMANSAELGLTVRFLQSSYQCNSISELATQLLETTEQYGVACCLLFKSAKQQFLFNCESDSIEAKVLGKVTNKHRILDFGARTIITDDHVTLLIKNMPLHNPEDHGRIKDNLAVLIDGTEARCKALEVEQLLAEQRKTGLTNLADFAETQLEDIREIIRHQAGLTESVVDSINRQLEEAVFRLGLSENEEKFLMASIDDAISNAGDIIQQSHELKNKFEAFTGELNKLIQS